VATKLHGCSGGGKNGTIDKIIKNNRVNHKIKKRYL